MTAAQQLRDAAALLRERAEAVDGGAWYVNREAPDMLPDVISECAGESCEGCGIVAPMVPEEVAAYIALTAPPFALAVAAWMERVAGEVEVGCSDLAEQQSALDVARVVLGGDQ